MKSGVKICYILSIVFSAILEVVNLIFIVPNYVSSIETLQNLSNGSSVAYNSFYTYYFTIVRLVLATLFILGLIVALVCSILFLSKVQDDTYYRSKKNGIYIASIILGIFSFPMILAGLFALIDPERKN